MITVHLFEHAWFWVIPLRDGVTSVGVVGTQALFKAKIGKLDTIFARAVGAGPSLGKDMTNAEPLGPLVGCADYSYDSRSYVGDRYILVGDAAAFIDPLFSSGVMMAMSSAAFGATVVDALLDDRQPRKELVRDYERKIRLSLTSLSWLIHRINSPILRDIFMSSFDLFNTRHGLIRILAGDFYEQRSFLSPLRRLQLAYGFLMLVCCMLAASNGTSVKDNTANWNSEMRVISRIIDDALASPGAAGFLHSIYSRSEARKG